MKHILIALLACALLGLFVSACQTTTAGGGPADDLTTTDRANAQNMAEAATTSSWVSRITQSVHGASVVAASARALTTSDIQTTLNGIFGAGTVLVTGQVNNFVITFTNATLTGALKINGTVTGSVNLTAKTLTLQTTNLTIGQTAISGQVVAILTATANTYALSGTLTVTRNVAGGQPFVLSLTLDCTMTTTSTSVALTGTITGEVGGVKITGTATNLTITNTSLYPTAGTLSFLSGNKTLTITFSGTTATVSDGEGHTATVPLPATA